MAQTPPTPPVRLSFSSLLSLFLTTSPLHLLSSLFASHFIFSSLSCSTVLCCLLLSRHSYILTRTKMKYIHIRAGLFCLQHSQISFFVPVESFMGMTVLETILPPNSDGCNMISFSIARKQEFIPESLKKASLYPYEPQNILDSCRLALSELKASYL